MLYNFPAVVYSLLIKKLSTSYSSFTLTYYASLTGVIMLVFLSMFEGWPSLSLASFYSVVYMGLFASGLGYLLYNYGINDLGPTKTASVVNSSVPVFVAVLAFLFFKEGVTFSMIASVVFVVIGLKLVLWNEKETK